MSAIIQQANGSGGPGLTITLPQTTIAGSLMVVAFVGTDPGSSGPIDPSDNQPSGNGTNYTKTHGGNSAEIRFLAPSLNLGGATSVTLNNVTSPTVIDAWVFELVGPGTDNDDDWEVGGPGPDINPTTAPIVASAPRSIPFPGISTEEFFVVVCEVFDNGGSITGVTDPSWTLAPTQRGNACAYKIADGTVDEAVVFINSSSTIYQCLGADYFTTEAVPPLTGCGGLAQVVGNPLIP